MAAAFESLESITSTIRNYVWGIPTIILIVFHGLRLTFRLRGIQFRKLKDALHLVFYPNEHAAGEVSSYGALCTALAATIGTGNIIGVSTAISTGGPGALFWMLVTALLGMATQYAEGNLSIKYRTVTQQSYTLGGPFYYIERGMGKQWRWMAKLFAAFAVTAGLLGIGTFTQVSSITTAVENFFLPDLEAGMPQTGLRLFGTCYSWPLVISGLLTALAAALILLGGIKRLTAITEFIVPFMAIGYILLNLVLLLCNCSKIPAALICILRGAFHPEAVTGGAVGSVIVVIQKGVTRSVFTNEAGMGTAAIAAAAAKTNSSVQQGLVAMTGTFIDTVILCSMTGLSIIVTGAWNTGLQGVAITNYAFTHGLPVSQDLASFFLMISLVFFAFATILGWYFYAERCLLYLVHGNRRAVWFYRVLYICAVFTGPYLTAAIIWNIADITNGLMAIPNLIALYALEDQVVSDTRQFYRQT